MPIWRPCGSHLGTVIRAGKVDRSLADTEQRALHGLAWTSALSQAIRQATAWALALDSAGSWGTASG